MRVGGIALLAGTVFIFGCATPPPDQSHKLSIKPPANWTAQREDPDNAFEDGWIGDFSDNRLEGIIGEALTHNFNLLATAARLGICPSYSGHWRRGPLAHRFRPDKTIRGGSGRARVDLPLRAAEAIISIFHSI